MWIRTQSDALVNSDHIRCIYRGTGHKLMAEIGKARDVPLGTYETDEELDRALHQLLDTLVGIVIYRPKGFGEGEN